MKSPSFGREGRAPGSARGDPLQVTDPHAALASPPRSKTARRIIFGPSEPEQDVIAWRASKVWPQAATEADAEPSDQAAAVLPRSSSLKVILDPGSGDILTWRDDKPDASPSKPGPSSSPSKPMSQAAQQRASFARGVGDIISWSDGSDAQAMKTGRAKTPSALDPFAIRPPPFGVSPP